MTNPRVVRELRTLTTSSRPTLREAQKLRTQYLPRNGRVATRIILLPPISGEALLTALGII